ncbi:type II toxin-antitoxin system PemK/MazF family toxin [Faecalibacterium sp. BCRC 81149]|uniref:type II toxin-antitoxin system PemK/MazF family toxin n=1 Tax=Faecalibacterium sp. BCRC 81149 TaxID=2315463 RepID=UPI00325A825F|nr:type II toxin-antitoxin system PemK/MazF family toxin [Faecalibacterium sp. BCRC 81149]
MIPKDWKYLRGDIYYADMEPHIGSEQGGNRPVVVLQNDVGNRYAPTLIVATVTSRTEKKKYQPTHVLIAHNTAFEKPSVVQLEQIFTIDKSRIQRFLGQTTRNEMRRIEEALLNSLEINEWDRRNADE